MQKFIARENIRRFRARLESCTDAAQRAILLNLIAAEEVRLAELQAEATSNRSCVPADTEACSPENS